MGIATKNAILLIDYVILARRDHGKNRWEALLDACRKRARPIVMTTVAMGAACCRSRSASARPELPRADGHRRDRRPHHVDVPEPARRPVVYTYVDDAIDALRKLVRWRTLGPNAAKGAD